MSQNGQPWSDNLALAVGKIILAWGRLDQQIHLMIKGMENALKEDFSIEGRFAERRKILRRLCLHMCGGDPEFMSEFDRAAAQLVRLERKRGRIAHGVVGDFADSAMFLDFAEALTAKRPHEEIVADGAFSYTALAQLEADIEACGKSLLMLTLEALSLWKQAGRPARER